MSGATAGGCATVGRNGKLVGDVEGDWEDNDGETVTIQGGTMRISDGTTMHLGVAREGTCSFSLNGQTFEGQLVGSDKMVWSDGAVWTRKRQPLTLGVGEGDDADDDEEAGGLESELLLLRSADGEQAEEEEPDLPAPPPARASQPARTGGGPTAAIAAGRGRLEVVARHATEDFQVRVVLPQHAKFKHIKKALAACLGSEEIARKALLTYKVGGRYRACKDEGRISDVRQVLVACAEFRAPDAGEPEATLSEGEVSAEETFDFLDGLDKEEEEEEEGVSTSASSSRPVKPAGTGGGRPGVPNLTLAQAISLQKELLAAFQEHRFQQRLESLDRIYGAVPNSMEFQQERQELFLSVQSVILPKYGFEGTLAGVYRMLGAMGAFIEDPEVAQLAKDINRLLGVRSPPSTWSSLSRECQKLDIDASDPDGSKAAAKRRQRPELVHLVPQPADGDAAPRSMLLPLVPPYQKALKQDPAPQPKAGGASAGGCPVEATAKPDALHFDPYPAGRVKPFKLFVVGTWSNYNPVEMHWQQGLFVGPVTLGTSGIESFQLLKNGKWSATVYPSVPDASPLEEHAICGPDGKGHGLNWTIGRFAEEGATPGRQYAIIVALDKQAAIRLVHWQRIE